MGRLHVGLARKMGGCSRQACLVSDWFTCNAAVYYLRMIACCAASATDEVGGGRPRSRRARIFKVVFLPLPPSPSHLSTTPAGSEHRTQLSTSHAIAPTRPAHRTSNDPLTPSHLRPTWASQTRFRRSQRSWQGLRQVPLAIHERYSANSPPASLLHLPSPSSLHLLLPPPAPPPPCRWLSHPPKPSPSNPNATPVRSYRRTRRRNTTPDSSRPS